MNDTRYERNASICTSMCIAVIAAALCTLNASASAKDRVPDTTLDVTLSCQMLDADDYPGVKVGTLFFIELTLKNNSNQDVHIGDYFRVLMTQERDAWNQFALAVVATNNLHVADSSHLRYGMGSATLVMYNAAEKSLLFNLQGNLISDISPERKGIDLREWWPAKLEAGTVTKLKWPVFWFSDTKDRPLCLAGPLLKADASAYYPWLDIRSGKGRLIPADTSSLLSILRNNSEPIGLRCASVRWLLECDPKKDTELLPYVQGNATPEALAFRAMQGLIIWGSESTLDDVFALWKARKLRSSLDKNLHNYLSWSELDHAKVLIKRVKANER